MLTLEDVIDRLSSAVDRSTTSAERIHRELAGMPFEFFARAELLRESASDVQAAQDRTLESIYELVRRINYQLTRLTSSIVSNGADGGGRKGRAKKTRTQGKKASARKPRKAAAQKSAKQA